MRRLLFVTGLLLAACNLQPQPPTPTPPPTVPELPQFVTATPENPSPALPTLLPTPTQLILVTATQSGAPTTIPLGGGEGVPTLDAALGTRRSTSRHATARPLA